MADNPAKKLVVIASSTGGPKALHNLVPMLDKGIDAPVVIVQHMPKGFTYSLAERLNEISPITVSEATHGERLEKGHVYLARGGKHLLIKEDRSGHLTFAENDDDPIGGLRPCANITFESLCKLSIGTIVCVVLTGMGADGCAGINKLKKFKKIYTIAQNQETCIIYGMPKAIVESGITDIVLPLEKISDEIIRKVGVR